MNSYKPAIGSAFVLLFILALAFCSQRSEAVELPTGSAIAKR